MLLCIQKDWTMKRLKYLTVLVDAAIRTTARGV